MKKVKGLGAGWGGMPEETLLGNPHAARLQQGGEASPAIKTPTHDQHHEAAHDKRKGRKRRGSCGGGHVDPVWSARLRQGEPRNLGLYT
jgi:hypothetical protein